MYFRVTPPGDYAEIRAGQRIIGSIGRLRRAGAAVDHKLAGPGPPVLAPARAPSYRCRIIEPGEHLEASPDFLVIGAARAGTTALHSYLRQHPALFLPSVKEPNFFAYEGRSLNCQGPGADFINNSVTSREAYRALFAAAPEAAVCGEASPLYLYEPAAPGNIHRLVPGVRLIAVLRSPVEQAFSHFMYATKLRIETEESFEAALMLEEERLAKGWQPLFGYSRFPRYGEQLARYLALFPAEQVLVRTYEDFLADPARLMADIFRHIGVDPGFLPDTSQRLNAGGRPKSRLFQDFLMKPNPITGAIGRLVPKEARLRIRDRLASINMTREDTVPPRARRILLDRLSDDIRHLEKLLGKDFSAWLR